MLKLIRFLIFQLDRLLDTKFWYFHRSFLFFAEKNYQLLYNYAQFNESKVAKILLPFALHYHRYYSDFKNYLELKRRLLNDLKLEGSSNYFDSTGVSFESYGYSEINKNKKETLKVLKDVVAKENFESIKKLKKIFYNKKVLLMGPSKISSKITLENFDLIAVSNTQAISHSGKKTLENNRYVIFVNIGYYNRNAANLVNTAEDVAEIFIKPVVDQLAFPKFVMPNGLLCNDYGPMGVQNMLYSIFLGEAESIYVTGVTGYLGDEVYRSGVKTYTDNKQHYSNNIRRHEPISNFCFIKNFINLGFCSGDNNFLRIFDNDINEYCNGLDKLYSSYTYRRIDISNLHSN